MRAEYEKKHNLKNMNPKANEYTLHSFTSITSSKVLDINLNINLNLPYIEMIMAK